MLTELLKTAGSRNGGKTLEPPVTIRETEKEIFVDAEMPGLRKENITVDLDRDELTLSGRQHEESPKGYAVVYQERTPFEYRRTFTLGSEIEREQISAAYENGVLTLSLPKSERALPRKITVQ